MAKKTEYHIAIERVHKLTRESRILFYMVKETSKARAVSRSLFVSAGSAVSARLLWVSAVKPNGAYSRPPKKDLLSTLKVTTPVRLSDHVVEAPYVHTKQEEEPKVTTPSMLVNPEPKEQHSSIMIDETKKANTTDTPKKAEKVSSPMRKLWNSFS